MHLFKSLLAGSILIGLTASFVASAGIAEVPESANWYFHMDLKRMKSDKASKGVYGWLKDEVFNEVKEDVGVDLDRELDSVTSFSVNGDGVVLFDGNMSQETRDKVMTFVASGGDIEALKSSGKSYYHFGGDKAIEDDKSYRSGKIQFGLESLGEESWVSMDLKNKLIITATEGQMKTLLKNNGKVAGDRRHNGALVILTAEKAIVQAGMNTDALDDDGGSDWNSNILRNTKEAAFLIAAAGDKLAIEAKLITKQDEMAESLASVVRGLISLAAFNDDMEPEMVALLRGTKVKTQGNNLSVSLAVDADLLVETLSD